MEIKEILKNMQRKEVILTDRTNNDDDVVGNVHLGTLQLFIFWTCLDEVSFSRSVLPVNHASLLCVMVLLFTNV